MADIKDKEYSAMKENLENLGDGAEKYQTTPVPDKPLPPNIVKQRYVDMEAKLTKAWKKAQDKLREKNEAFDDLKVVFTEADGLYSKDVRTIKGIYTIYSEILRDFGVAPEKKRTRKPKPPTS